jgi:hypothetical protein
MHCQHVLARPSVGGHAPNFTGSRNRSTPPCPGEPSKMVPLPHPLPISFFICPPLLLPSSPLHLPFPLIPPPISDPHNDAVPSKSLSLDSVNPDLIALFSRIIGTPAGRSFRGGMRRLPYPNRPAVQAHQRMFFHVQMCIHLKNSLNINPYPSRVFSMPHADMDSRIFNRLDLIPHLSFLSEEGLNKYEHELNERIWHNNSCRGPPDR